MRSLLRPVALGWIVASLLPQVAATADALHVLLDHRPEHGHATPDSSMVPVLHGHAHSAGTPDHDHPLTVPSSSGVTFHARAPLQLALPVGCCGISAAIAPVDVLAMGERSASKRPTQAIPTVLRI